MARSGSIPRTVVGEDVQSSRPAFHVSLTRAGVTGVQKVVRIAHEGRLSLLAAEIECSVDLEPGQKGVHMSRFPEIFGEAIDSVVIDEEMHVEELAGRIAEDITRRQGALRSEVRIEARTPRTRTTPVSGMRTQEVLALIGWAGAGPTGVRQAVGVRVQGINACPCAQGMVRDRADERLAGLGYDDAERERILDAVPIATHNQRGEATLVIGGAGGAVDARDLTEIAEKGMSAPILELLKRPDELWVVEEAHAHPRFVEDSVRHMVAGVVERWPDLPDTAFVLAKQVNFETIHAHDVLAERSGLLGELRAELAGDENGGAHVGLDAWIRGIS